MQLMGCNSYKVQLLVTSQDVDNYKQIKQDLDQLRSIVEKSELWVYKGQGPDETMDVAAGENEHKKKEVKSAFYLDFWSWYIIGQRSELRAGKVPVKISLQPGLMR